MDHNAALDLPAEDVRALESLRSRLMPLVYNIERMLEEMQKSRDVPPNWPSIHRATTLLNSHMKSLQDYLNAKVTTDTTQTNAQLLSRLRPYPIAPFNTIEKAGIVETLTRKKPEPRDENWIEDRIRKASEFCDVPSDWNVESKPSNDTGSEGIGGGNDDDDGFDEGSKDGGKTDPYGGVKRIKTKLEEDEITALWEAVPVDTKKLQLEFRDAVKGDPRTTLDAMPKVDQPAYIERFLGLRRKLGLSTEADEEEDDDDEDDGDGEDDREDEGEGEASGAVDGGDRALGDAQAERLEQAAVPLGMILKFMNTGDTNLPFNVGM